MNDNEGLSDFERLCYQYNGQDPVTANYVMLQAQINNFTLVHRQMIHITTDPDGLLELILGDQVDGI